MKRFLVEADVFEISDEEDDRDSERAERYLESVMKKFQLDVQYLSGPHRLTDRVINAAQVLLRTEYGDEFGLQDPLLGQTCSFQQRHLFVQIHHMENLHWVVSCNGGCKKDEVAILDSCLNPPFSVRAS